jgi:nitrogen regulatory protein PII
MKRIEAIIRPSKQALVLATLAKQGITNVTVIETLGHSRQVSHSQIYELTSPHEETQTGLIPKRLLVMFVNDDQVQPLIELIQSIAYTGEAGDGKIIVSPIEQLVRIRPKTKPVAA